MNTNKNDIAKEIAKALGRPVTHVEPLLEAYLKAIKDRLAAGEDIEIRGFGSFRRRIRKAHPGRNPRTGVVVVVPEHYVVKFRPAKEMKRVVDP